MWENQERMHLIIKKHWTIPKKRKCHKNMIFLKKRMTSWNIFQTRDYNSVPSQPPIQQE
jgi:hypothetical protein